MNKQELYDYIKNLPNTRVVDGSEIACRCFLCGDSYKNPNKKRLYIKCDTRNPKEPILYNCFNCFRKGVFNVDMLHQMEGFDPDVESSIRKLNKSALSDDGTRYNRYKNNKEIEVKIPPLYNNKKTMRKLAYVYKERGFVLPLEDLESLKIIWNLKDFLKLNDIEPANQYVDILDNDYVGFLSVYNEYIIFRDITNMHKMRYVKYNIFNTYDNSHAFYRINNPVNLLTTDDVHIVVTEGTFDILGVRYHIHDNHIDNKLYVASCNGSFIDTIMHYIRKGFVGDNIYVDCYQDNDTKLNFRNIRNQLYPYVPQKNFNVYYNVLSKDFGVPKEQIQVDRIII